MTTEISELGLSLIVVDHEYHDNLKTIRRLAQSRDDIEERLANLDMRQNQLRHILSCAHRVMFGSQTYSSKATL